MPETTDTRPNLFPAGEYELVATKPCVKKLTKTSSKPYYEFVFEGTVDGELKDHKEILFPSQCGFLLKALQCKEKPGEPGIFVWEKDEIVGRRIKAKIIHEADKKDSTRMRAKIAEAQ